MTFVRRSRRQQERTPPPSPLDLPEVLELVLSHLSQYSLNHRARLVSKLWNSTSLRLIHRTLTWCDQINIPEQQRILDQVGYTNILRVTARILHLPRSLHFEDVAWGNLYGAYKSRRQPPTSRLSGRIPMVLEQLVVEGIVNLNRRLQPLWPHIPSVRTIRIKTIHKNEYHVEIILRSCPNLTELFLEPVAIIAFPVQYMARLAKPPSLASEEAGIDPSEPPLPILRLESLVMMHMIVEESYLIPILKKCPSLRELRVDGMQRAQNAWMNLTIGGVTAAGSQASLHQQRQEFFKDLASWCPRLESLHLSHRDLFLTPADTTTVFSVFSRLSTISLATRDVCGPILDILLPPKLSSRSGTTTVAPVPKAPRLSGNFITFLEIVRPPAYYDEAMLSKVLHSYLCQAPHLLTLRAEHILFYLEHMDVRSQSNMDNSDIDNGPRSRLYSMDYIDRDEGDSSGLAGAGLTTTSEYHSTLASWTRTRLQHSTLPGTGTSSSRLASTPKPVWACRNLQTLHLSFQARMGDSDNAEQNRIMFGYIGRVCPRLRELVLYRSLMRLSLDGGLCLLTRLVDLERLMIGARLPSKMSDKDFSWLARPMNGASSKTAGHGIRQEEAITSNSTMPWTRALHSMLFGDRSQRKVRQPGAGHEPSPSSSVPSSPSPPDSRPASPTPSSSGLSMPSPSEPIISRWNSIWAKKKAGKSNRIRRNLSTSTSTTTDTNTATDTGTMTVPTEEPLPSSASCPPVLPPLSFSCAAQLSAESEITASEPRVAPAQDPFQHLALYSESLGHLDPPAAPSSPPSGQAKESESAAEKDMALRKLLKHLGTSRDVREALQEKDQGPEGFCWPRLEELTIHFVEPWQPDPVDLQKIVAKYRPEIQFRGVKQRK
ncbi:hypothetical protein BGZ81_001443 [Podila clonocystis]|nr:hypothetical protein BGZ81_001443 [Podila clonocystis]